MQVSIEFPGIIKTVKYVTKSLFLCFEAKNQSPWSDLPDQGLVIDVT